MMFLLLAMGPVLAAPIEIRWWIGLTGPAQEQEIRLAEEFNRTQSEYKVTATFQGQYPEERAAAFAAFKDGNPPHILQMFDAGSAEMIHANAAILAVSDAYDRAGIHLDPTQFIPAARDYYSTTDHRLLSQPFNLSTGVLFFNRDAFRHAGLDPDKPPATWPALIDAATALRAAGSACGFTTTWLSWIMLEQFSAIHDQALATQHNGRDGADAVLTFNTPLQVRMVDTLATLQQDNRFDYVGRSNEAAAKFTNGDCAMLLQSSGGQPAIERDAGFAVGVAPLPYWPDIAGAPHNTMVGGASNWVFRGFTDAEYRGIVAFLTFLAKPENDAQWARSTGFLPTTVAGYQLMRHQGFFSQHPGRDVAVQSLMRGTLSANSWGYRLGCWSEIRDIFDEEVERALAQQQSGDVALDNAVRRGNELLRQFQQNAACG
ncbi:MAG: sn-glycerol-3-phosphate ABC transporter substrate-binding protein UgpB [Azospirillaceae bacterium]|nr:sn-glycerol-3-phosphate ABC transporter substrate-binding protein UgpB [Azospirillaceae bacterium]